MSTTANVIRAVQTHGVPPSIISHISVNNWTIHPSYRDCFDIYYLLHWQSKYILERISNGALEIGNYSYVVVYHRTTRGRLLAAPEKQVAISFRAAKPEFGIPAYALVSLLPDSN